MPHLEDSDLNEYLDGALPAGQRTGIEAHLAACPACAARLAELENVFAALSSLPEENLGRDLSVSVQTAIQFTQPARRTSHAGWLALAVEALVGIILGLLAWQPGLPQVLIASIQGAAGSAASPLQAGLAGLAAQAVQIQIGWQGLLNSLAALPGGLNERLWPAAASIPLEAVLIGLVAAGLGWLALNVLLLKPKSR